MSDQSSCEGRGLAAKSAAPAKTLRDETGAEIKFQGVSIHVVDVTRGRAAVGMKVEVYGPGNVQIYSGTVKPNGLVDDQRLVERLPLGTYVVLFYASDYFRKVAPNTSEGTVGVVRYDFGISDPERHYHLPMKFSQFGFSCFLGGYGSADL